MKISEMTKDQLREYMQQTGEMNRPDKDSRSWQRAFELARAAGMGDLDFGCQRCWDKVITWIKK